MKALVIGATGSIGGVVAATLDVRGHEVVRASRSGEQNVDVTDPASIRSLFERVGPVDAVVVAVGSVPFKPLTDLDRDDYLAAFTGKTLAQLDVVRVALDHVTDGGSLTLTSGVLAREPIATGAAAAMANGALESFVITAAAEAPRGIRINAVSPDVLANSPGYFSAFPGHRPVTDDEVGQAYVRAVEGIVSGRVLPV
ncbi:MULTISPECIES: short chain dehydrogenase [Actinomycetes]|uniref:short chain dehydrogenase n=1 Tax=Actinomycetes TaxID=1760 RepID=UPI0024687980|nr:MULTISPECIES: short chain dehydrogenase [unclassified Microbacterium]MDH5133790.1 short chain dehydrogenase [Microbacterium sp. RD10]MDH5137546.1 short chain dehydrogenase [Microbacterium sp. RD11]MDH5144779.1 short chain dehydrogenase [Microbacterium sp. RD12]MDH5155632.1 short chain dehydrogenase [Microbacterium sp. RD06]MDH5166932.1 short chain dehydrogenase [Microbacterium sp. RD02]